MDSEISERIPLATQQGSLHCRTVHYHHHQYDKLLSSSTTGSLGAGVIASGGSQKRKRRIVRKNLCPLFESVQDRDISGSTQSYSTLKSGPKEISQAVSEDATVMTNNSIVSDIDVWNLSQGSGDSSNSLSCTPAIADESSAGGIKGQCQAFDAVPLVDLLCQTDRGGTLSLVEVKALLYSIAKDLCDIHASGRVHTRVCFDSILLKIVQGTGRASLLAGHEDVIMRQSDLRNMRDAPQTEKNHVAYIAPESLYCANNNKYHRSLTEKGNMWSFGCILFCLLSGGDILFEESISMGDADGQLVSVDKQQARITSYINNKITDMDMSPDTAGSLFHRIGFNTDAIHLIQSVLRVDPGQRLTAREVVKHPWFDGVRQCIPQYHQNDVEDAGKADVLVSEEQELVQPANHQFSPLHNRFIYIDPSLLSPMHPYALVGHIKKEVHFESMGETFKAIGIFAVYDVPGHGTMMSAKPVRITPY